MWTGHLESAGWNAKNGKIECWSWERIQNLTLQPQESNFSISDTLVRRERGQDEKKKVHRNSVAFLKRSATYSFQICNAIGTNSLCLVPCEGNCFDVPEGVNNAFLRYLC